MLTIRAMVRVGPWTVLDIERVSPAERCERCGTRIREVWVCEVPDIPRRSAAQVREKTGTADGSGRTGAVQPP